MAAVFNVATIMAEVMRLQGVASITIISMESGIIEAV